MKILVTDSGSLKSGNDLSLEPLNRFGKVFEYESISSTQLIKELPDTDIILCNKTVIDKNIMDKSPNLKYIGLFATGYNNIDIAHAKQKNIVVCNAGTYSVNAVAQQVIAYILNFYTRINEYNDFVKNGGWKNSRFFAPLVFPTDEVYGKTLGIIGYGSIGKAVAEIALALGMKVLIYTRTVKSKNPKFVSFDFLLRHSDIVSVHCPLNEQSCKMFDKNAFEKFKDGAFFINTARGGIVDEQALFDALQSKKLSGAAIDVLHTEPMKEDCVLLNAKNILITPHTCWAPLTTRKRLLNIVCDNISAFLNGNPQNNIAK